MKKAISMSTKELSRAEIIMKVKEKAVSQSQAAEILCISVRQVKRLVKRYRDEGPQGLIPNAIQKWGIFEVKRLRFELGEAGAEGAIYLKTK